MTRQRKKTVGARYELVQQSFNLLEPRRKSLKLAVLLFDEITDKGLAEETPQKLKDIASKNNVSHEE